MQYNYLIHPKMVKRITALFLFLTLLSTVLHGQRQDQRRSSAYQSLLMRTDRPHAYFDHVSFPVNDGTSQFALLFRLDYDSIPFMKTNGNITPPNPEAEYYSTVQIGVEIYEGEASRSRRSEMAPSIYRDAWQDTIWVNTFEKTSSRTDYAQGFIDTNLDIGSYHYDLQLPGPKIPSAARNNSSRNRPSPTRNVNITGTNNAEKPDFILLKSFQAKESAFSATFLNYGDNVLYGQDYSVLVRIPTEAEANSLVLKLFRIIGGGDSDSQELRHSQEITPENTLLFSEITFMSNDGEIGFEADITNEGARYAYVNIPNNNFENSVYKLALENSETDELLGEKRIRSQWLDMPVSLYNLDVATDMLRFIVDDEKLNELNAGSNSERERKFREFWAQRDPSPNTEFNELMTEYYNRIDYAYNEFSSLQTPGYETDQGRAYILYGPPNDIERRLPSNAPTREIWHYPGKTLIFEATTGFGDFKLISEQQS